MNDEPVRDWDRRLETLGWWHSFELPNRSTIQGACSLEGLKRRLALFPIPADLHGKRVLDIGAWDGWFSFEMEKRGAEVVAIDTWRNPKFLEIRERLSSRVEYNNLDVYELDPRKIGTFDIVLFLGVLYHLKHPLLGLEKVCSVTRELAIVDTHVITNRNWAAGGRGALTMPLSWHFMKPTNTAAAPIIG